MSAMKGKSSRSRQGVSSSSGGGTAVSSTRSGGSRAKDNKMSSLRYKNRRFSLSAINEGDEHTTLQDVLNVRGSWLSHEELWAVCRECCLTLQRIDDSAEIVQSLCVMLETVAFDSQGNVCFNDHEYAEPDAVYKPPEYDKIGNSCKGHIYSLGMLISEASAYNSGTDTNIPQHSPRLRKLLSNMMETDYAERITLDETIHECDQFFLSAGLGSSHDICKHLISSASQSINGTESPDKHINKDETDNMDTTSHHLSDTSIDSNASISKPLLSTSTDMSLQELVEKYTPGRLKAIVAQLTNVHADASHVHGIGTGITAPGSIVNKHNDSDSDETVVAEEPDENSNDQHVILSPPEGFGKVKNKNMASSTGSAFAPKSTSLDRKKGMGEGATLKAGVTPLKLPDAYRSSATHFTPIVLSSHEKKTSPARSSNTSSSGSAPAKADRASRNIKELKKQLLKKHNVQEGEAKLSPRQPDSDLTLTAQDIPSRNNIPAESQESIRPSAASKPVTAAKPSIAQPKDRGGASTPVTQAVRPLPRTSGNSQTVTPTSTGGENINNSNNRVTNISNSMNNISQISIPSSSVQTTEAVHTLPLVTNAHTPHTPHTTQQPIVMNGTTISSPAIIPSYPSMQFVLQQDPSTGAMNWIPVMPNMPYWPVSPQQAPAQAVMQQTPVNAAHQMTPSMPSATHVIQNGDTTPTVPVPTSAAAVASILRPSNQTSQETQNINSGNSQPPSALPTSNVISDMVQSARVHSESIQTQSTPAKPSRERKSRGTTSKDAPPKPSRRDNQENQTLSKIRQLLKNEFAYDGYMNQSQEDLEIAKFLGSLHLPALDFTSWCNIIVAKYGDLYWADELLVSLYEAIHGNKPQTDRPPSGALRAKSARVISVDEPGSKAKQSDSKNTTQRFATSPFRPIPLADSHLSTASSTPKKSTKSSLVKPKPVMPQIHPSDTRGMDVVVNRSPISRGLTRLKSASVTEADFTSDSLEDLSRGSYQTSSSSGGLTKSRSQNNILQIGNNQNRSMTPLVKSLVLPNGGTRQVMYIEGKQTNTFYDEIISSNNRASSAGSAFEQESDSHSHSSASELRVKGRLHSSTYSFPGGNHIDDQFNDSAFGSKLSSEYESDNSLVSHTQGTSKDSGINHTIMYASYLAENSHTITTIGDKSENKSVDGLKKKIADLNQQISVNCKRRNKAFKYITKILDSSSHSSNNKGVDYKSMLAQIKVDHREAVKELDYLSHAKSQLEVLLAGQAAIEVSCLFSFTKASRPLLVIETKENPRLQFQTKIDSKTSQEVETLYAGEGFGLLSYLYAKGSLEDGYILHFFHSYRYVLATKDVLAFITEKYNAAKELKPCDAREKVMKRSMDMLTFWVTSYYTVDFFVMDTVVETLINFLQEEALQEHIAECEPLLKVLDEYENDKGKNSSFVNPLPDNDDLPYVDEETNPITKRASLRRSNTLLRRTEIEEWAEESKWNSNKSILTIGSGRSAVQYQRTGHGIVSCVSLKSGRKSSAKELYHPTTSRDADAFSITDYSSSDLAEQLTLMDQKLFVDVHPVNFMNTLAQGIGASMIDSAAETIPQKEMKTLFSSDYVQFVSVTVMIQHSKKLAHWVTAEVINANSTKAQTAVLTKFLQVAKICKNLRNFATCVSVKDGLDHPLIRHIPAWKEIPSKLIHELEDLKMSLKTEADAIRPPDDVPGLPTIPCASLFALHVQQLEQGGFTLANGMYRWPKLRSLAALVDVIRLCKTYKYDFPEKEELSEALSNRISEINTHNLETLVITASSDRGGSGSAATRWSNVLKKVKGKFA